MLRIDRKVSLNHIDYKQRISQPELTIDSLLAAITNQPQTDKTRLLDFGPWRHAHPEFAGLDGKFDAPHNLETDSVYDEHSYQAQEIQNKEQRPSFASRFRER